MADTTSMDTMEESSASQKDEGEIRIKLFSNIPQFSVTDKPIAVPRRLRRVHLSQMVNHLLQLDPPKTFDFVSNGNFIRSSLGGFIDSRGLQAEEILSVEFVEAMAPPEPPLEYIHDDWIASVSGHAPSGLTATGSYDNLVRVWTDAGECLGPLDGHEAVVNSVAWVPATDNDETVLLLASGSRDEKVRLWNIDSSGKSSCLWVGKGHKNGVNSVAVQPTGKMIASGGSDRNILLWATAGTSDEEQDKKKTNSKRRRTTQVTVEHSLGKLTGSGLSVTTVSWPERDTLYSGGEDHCLRIWDVELAKCKRNMVGSKVINEVALSKKNSLIAAAEFDGNIRMYDPRSDEAMQFCLSSHKRPVCTVVWSPENSNQLVSGSQDGEGNNLKIWDIRSRKIPIHNISGPKGKVFSVDWVSKTAILSGGEDCRLMVHPLESN
eukprot:m.21650 g.21650  ORF g.21650 m.21650 type:complete len:435 (-) comp7196_c0_seq1:50-1354(-)